MFDRHGCQFEIAETLLTDRDTPQRFASSTDITQSNRALSRFEDFSRHQLSNSKVQVQRFPWQHLVAGAAAGAVSRSATAPLELLRLQAMTGAGFVEVQDSGGAAALKQKFSLQKALQTATQGKGWHELWRGNGLNVLRAGPQKAIDFFSFELYKTWFGSKLGPGPVSVLPSAALAGATSTAVLHPIEVVRSRITCDRVGRYRSGVIAALSSIIKQEGPLALYTGVGPSLAAIMPEAAITYGLFDLLTKGYMKSAKKEKPGVAVAVAAGVMSSCLGQTVSFPLETISRRLQVGAANGAKASVGKTVQRIIQEHGMAGFYQGFEVGLLRAVPMSALSFGTYELVRAWLSVQSGSSSNKSAQTQRSQRLKAS